MNIIIFGATGGVGQHAVKLAVDAGHNVTAFVRTPEKLNFTEGVTIIKGDAFDPQAVADAIAGHDAVMSCLGSSTGMKPSNDLERMGKNIADGMKSHHVTRLVYCASAGVFGEIPGVAGKLMQWLLRNPLKDHKAALDYYLANEQLNYTIARPMGLKNEAFVENYQETFEGVPAKSTSIPRACVAHFLVKALSDEKYFNTSVGLAK